MEFTCLLWGRNDLIIIIIRVLGLEAGEVRFLRAGMEGEESDLGIFPGPASGLRGALCLAPVFHPPGLTNGFPTPLPQEPGRAHPGGEVPPPWLLHLRRLRAEPEDAWALLGGG